MLEWFNGLSDLHKILLLVVVFVVGSMLYKHMKTCIIEDFIQHRVVNGDENELYTCNNCDSKYNDDYLFRQLKSNNHPKILGNHIIHDMERNNDDVVRNHILGN